ncbi:MAG: hypothetical protein ABIZ05_00370 [Pseudonocardiaceae bacterium]
MEIKAAQRLTWQNKIAKGFNTSDVPLEFMLLHGEIAESFQAWRHAQSDLGEELADVALYLFALAEMNSVDLDDEIQRRSSRTLAASTARTATACSAGRQKGHPDPAGTAAYATTTPSATP